MKKNSYNLLKKLLFLFLLITIVKAQSQPKAKTNTQNVSIESLIANAQDKYNNGDMRDASDVYNIIATKYWEQKDYANAVIYFEKSIKINELIGNDNAVTGINSNLAMIYFDTYQFEKSISYFLKVKDARKKAGDKYAYVASCINLAVSYNKIQKYNETILLMEDGLKASFQVNNFEQMRGCYGLISETYDKMGNREKATEYFDLYKTFNDMARKQSEQKLKKNTEESRLRAELMEMEAKNKQLLLDAKTVEISKKENIISSQSDEIDKINGNLSKTEMALQLVAEREKIDKIQLNQAIEAKKSSEKQAFYTAMLALFGLLFFITIGFFVIKNNRERKKNNEILQLKNNEITEKNNNIVKQNAAIKDSINYAKRIQNALLPSEKLIKESFKDTFILYKPKDIVCGDFYWHKNMEINNESYSILAAVDCTGHGVPGAFMSAIGMNILNKIVDVNCYKPGQILSKLHFELSKSLENDDVEIRDGMDISVIVVAQKQQKTWYAGAKNQIVYFQNEQLIEIKANKEPIGGQINYTDISFTEYEINVSKDTIIYMFTDGFQDQFGGAEIRKFMYKNFKNLLSKIHLLPMQYQKNDLENHFETWKQAHKQTDDVLVIGIKI